MSSCIAVSFDVWGTLVDLNMVLTSISEVASRKLQVSLEKAQEAVFNSYTNARRLRRLNPSLNPMELLSKSRDLMATSLSTTTEMLNSIIEEAFKDIKTRRVVFPDVPGVLEKLREENVYMGLIGNVLFWPSKYTMLLLEEVGLSEYFKITVFSDVVGYAKPDRAIFLEFAKASGFKPDNIIHVGDNIIEDVGGALSSGFTAVLIDRDAGRSIYVEKLNAAVINSMNKLVGLYRRVSARKCR
ncbi:MAG: HAD family hydrolase [Desulfurococcus sp.]|nr:HAD family hydrolase [Desulfurococcus sp.]